MIRENMLFLVLPVSIIIHVREEVKIPGLFTFEGFVTMWHGIIKLSMDINI